MSMCILSKVPCTIPLFFLISTSSPDALTPVSVTATTRPYGHADTGSWPSVLGRSSSWIKRCSLFAVSRRATPSLLIIRYGFRQAFISRMAAYFCESAGGICWIRASGLVAVAVSAGAAGGLEHDESRPRLTANRLKPRYLMSTVYRRIPRLRSKTFSSAARVSFGRW
jgi:hypothetical protein